MAESIDILISADDKASSKFLQVGNNAELLGKRVKETGRSVKASTELVGSFANALGGTQFGGTAGQLAQLTERISAFSEVAKAGGAAALFLKAGIVAAIGVATYKVAEGIASWYMDIDKVNAAYDETVKKTDKIAESLRKVRQEQLGRDKEDLSLILGSAEREQATIQRAKEIESQVADIQARIERQRKDVNEKWWEAQGAFKIPFTTTPEQNSLETARKSLADSIALQEELKAEAQQLRDLVSERAKSIEARKAENAATLRSSAFVDGLREEIALLKATTEEQRRLTAERNAPKQTDVAAELIAERDLLREQVSERKRIADLEDRELDRLELRRIEIEQGTEAARAFALQMQGASEEFARNIAAREAALDVQSKMANARQPGSLVAFESRVMTRGQSVDPQLAELKKIAEKSDKNTEKLEAKLEAIYQESKRRGQFLEVQVVQ